VKSRGRRAIQSDKFRDAPAKLWNVFVTLFVLSRYGIVALVIMQFFSSWSRTILTVSPEHWYAVYSWLAIGVYLAVALYGFRAALAGQKLFSAELDA
jgi:hypothetical protein